MKGLSFFVCGIIGVAFTRYFFLQPLEILGWNIFWNNLDEGRIFNLDTVFGSTTFLKCAIGFLVGGLLGLIRFRTKKESQINTEESVDSNEEEQK